MDTKQGLIAAALVAGLGVAGPVLAQHERKSNGKTWDDPDPAPYVGVAFRKNFYDDWDFSSNIDRGAFTSTLRRDTDSGHRFFAGLDLLTHFAIEASYADLGETIFIGQSDGSGTFWGTGPIEEKLKLNGYALHLLGRVPILDNLLLTARAGAWRWDARQRFSGTAYVNGTANPAEDYSFAESRTSTRLSYGFGLAFDAFQLLRVTAEYDVMPYDGSDAVSGDSRVRAVGLSMQYFYW